ncbi:EAL domain-containing protein [Cytobacillus firmus]|uniref:Diguanylate phosphodiesterase n=1 Tax=Cytobacillus firmus DS1 TaxID=1307436 RepID=W7L8K3_CYTFI|nr:EAL domain-containing protein [Cytobacillus firmus]EWG11546.1 diguanylate phosphodiesterase [Cytobacillus firmus DS1]
MAIQAAKLDAIEHIYQPMWNLNNWSIFGYEALLRFTEQSAGRDIESAFYLARRENRLYELDSMAIESAISNFPLASLTHELLFINIFPSTLLDYRFPGFIRTIMNSYSVVPDKIVFELNETQDESHAWEIPELKERLALLKDYGFHIALDDVGKGAATLQKIIEFEPNYIKLDRYFSEGLSKSKEKQELISLFISYSKHKMGLILEGIEKDTDLAQAKLINVPVVQGYLLGKPQKITPDNLFGKFRESLNPMRYQSV